MNKENKIKDPKEENKVLKEKLKRLEENAKIPIGSPVKPYPYKVTRVEDLDIKGNKKEK